MLTHLWRLRVQTLGLLSRYPSIYLPLCRLFISLGLKNGAVVGTGTELVIEGYPRSANTFALYAFEIAQQRQVQVAHHLHSAGQVLWAARKGIPTVVLIRNPREAVSSRLIREPRISTEWAIKDYIQFYERIIPVGDRCLFVTFEEVTGDFGKVIEAVNDRFGTQFSSSAVTSETESHVISLIEENHVRNTGSRVVRENQVARPSRQRNESKALLARELGRKRVRPLLKRAEDLYDQLLCQIHLQASEVESCKFQSDEPLD